MVKQKQPRPRGRPQGVINAKQKVFCRHYFECGNAEKAKLLAGYSHGYNPSIIMEKPWVKEYLAGLTDKRNKRLDVDADTVLTMAMDVVKRAKKAGNLNAELKAIEIVGKHAKVGAFKEIIESTNKNININAEMEIDKALQAIEALAGKPDTE